MYNVGEHLCSVILGKENQCYGFDLHNLKKKKRPELILKFFRVVILCQFIPMTDSDNIYIYI